MEETSKARVGAEKFAAPGQKVKPFARFEGTSAWRKDKRRVKEYAAYRAALKASASKPATSEQD